MRPAARGALALVAVANLVLGAAYALQAPWALAAWPWETGRLSYIFVGSILAAIAAGAAWIAFSGEVASLRAGTLNLAVTLAGVSGHLLLTATQPGRGDLLPYALAAGGLALLNVVLFTGTRRAPVPAADPLPRTVRASFAVFTAILLAVGIALILRRPGVMPWPLDPDTSVVVGWIFLGDAFYFLYALLRPRWDAARAQLWSFLAYDAVLLGPLLAHYAAAPPELRRNVAIYAAVLLYSAGLAIFYLVVNPRTRGWGNRAAGERRWAASR